MPIVIPEGTGCAQPPGIKACYCGFGGTHAAARRLFGPLVLAHLLLGFLDGEWDRRAPGKTHAMRGGSL